MPGFSQIDTEDVGNGRDRVARVKLVLGALGVDGGDLSSANPLPVTVTGGSETVTIAAGSAIIGKVGIDQTTPGTTNLVVAAGDVAHDAVDSGNPVKIGGKANSGTPVAVASGDRVDAWLTTEGAQIVVSRSASAATADGISATYAGLSNFSGGVHEMQVREVVYNGSTCDRRRNNHEVTVLASAARTTSVNSSDLTNYNTRGVVITIDCTANASTIGITVSIKYKDTLSGKYVALLTGAAIFATSATGTVSMVVYPGETIAANLAASAPLPRIWRVEVVHGDAGSITYSIGANYIN